MRGEPLTPRGSGTNQERRRRTVSFLVTTSGGGKTLQWTLSLGAVRGLVAAVAALGSIAIAGLALMAWVPGILKDRRGLEAQNDSLRSQFARLERLESEIARLEQLDEQMRMLVGAGLEDSASGGPRPARAEPLVEGLGDTIRTPREDEH